MAREIDAVRHRLAGGPPIVPEHDELREVVLRAGGPDLVDLVVAELPTRAAARRAAVSVPALGLLPEDDDPFARAVNDAIDDGPEGAHLALALSTFAPVTVRALQAAVRPGADPVSAAPVVLRYATQIGRLEPAAQDVAAGLDLERDLGAVLQLLGVPHFVLREGRVTPAAAAARGAAAAGAAAPEARVDQMGAVRHQVAAWIRVLLTDVPGPASALLRAAAPRGLAPSFVASAAWLRTFAQTDDPVRDVVTCSAGLDRRRLSAARRALGTAHIPLLLPAIGKDDDATVLACALRAGPAVADALVSDFLATGDEATGRAAATAAASVAPAIHAALNQTSSLPRALYLAAFLDAPPPGLDALDVAPADRPRLAWALASHFPDHPRLVRLGPLAPTTAALR